MDPNERQIIAELFAKLQQAEAQAGPRDGEAEAHIRELVARQPAAPYYMAQAIVIQEQALAAAQTRIQELERQRQARPAGGFLSGLFGGGGAPRSPAPVGQPGSGDPRAAAYAQAHQPRSGGFMAGAMQTAMGVAGGVLIGNALGSMFSSGEAVAEEALNQAGEMLPEEIGFEEDTSFDGGDEEI